ncbi:MAG: prepilin-type N-terminal cleavage/methylation domain-containing protein [Elusimicrobiaceae bacterium]|nr:prepilin-type N-terminal cleavage/methylation domain-containing protein [Elusimicrobiaceae bacterium]
MINKKKAFTLTELLVVVVIVGILATVTLPKFGKVLETRKTTEAEEMMRAVRTEQERRCSLDKPYLSSFENLSDLVRAKETEYYKYSLTASGIIASSKGKYSYDLKMPSYADGRICCEGDSCKDLNKDYPSCSSLPASTRGDDACLAPVVEPQDPTGCLGPATQSCGCKEGGVQSRTCNVATGVWSDWGPCSMPDECTCTGEAERACDCHGNVGDQIDYSKTAAVNVGTQTRVCNTQTGTWGSWGECSVLPCTCQWQPGHAENHYTTVVGTCAQCEKMKDGASCGTCGLQTQGTICDNYITDCTQVCKVGENVYNDLTLCNQNQGTLLCAITHVTPTVCTCPH